MAKKKPSAEETGPLVCEGTLSEPCWQRHQSRAVSCCEVKIDLGGPHFTVYPEFTEYEEHETKDLSALKRERLREALQAVYDKAMEYLNG